jgi:hypothetical protein
MDILLTATLNRSLFVNGLNQNIIFLTEMLKDMGHNVCISVNHDVEDCIDPPLNVLIMKQDEINDYTFDYILQIGSPLKNETIAKAKESNPKLKNIHIHYGNRLIADIEQCASNTSYALSHYSVDEVWISPHYSFSIPYLQTYYRTEKVFLAPYIWAPKYMDEVRRYSPEDEKNIAITEPNISFTKNCLLPIYLTEKVFRKDPSSFNRLHVYCSYQFKDKTMFISLMKELTMESAGRVGFAARNIMKDIFGVSNVLVSHQLYNGLNYTYLEALYLGMPVIHNSKYIKDAGYYFPTFNINKGAEKLHKALLKHDESLESYKLSGKKVIERFSPDNPSVRSRYQSLFQ